MHVHEKIDVKVNDKFLEKFANRYIEQRSQLNFDLKGLDDNILFKTNGFDSKLLEGIIREHAVAHDFLKDKNNNPDVLRNIYRSDLGELLMTYYFEEKLDSESKFIIPLKNITFRERADMPGRGLDAIGYRVDSDKITVLLGEAKVSHERKSPPSVVDKTEDSIYKTHKKHNDNIDVIIERLTDYCRRLGTSDAEMIGLVILSMKANKKDVYSLTFGSTLIRDFKCVNESSDFGKMKTNIKEFTPNKIHFSILSFTEKEISETVELFFKKVQELIK
jgi:hypothetical protein